MSHFQFRLQTLLKIRENERQQRQADLAKALEAEAIVQRELDAAAAEIAGAKAKIRALSAGGELPVDSVLELQRYGLQLRVHSAVLAEKLNQVRAEAERRRALLVEANRQVRILEKLRETQATAFETEQLQREQKVLDEVAQRVTAMPYQAIG